jgi:signal transduction histidine kinase
MNSRDRVPPKTEDVDYEWREQTISELFHTISQPLTGLHCLLEVSLLKMQKAEGYRRDIQQALEAASRLVESLRQAREMAEAENPGNLKVVDLSQVVRDVAAEFAPLLEMTHNAPITSLDNEVSVRADMEKLRRAIFYLFDDVLHDLPLGSELFLATEVQIGAVFYIGPRMAEASLSIPDDREAVATRTIAIAERTLQSIGGRVCRSESPQGRSFWVELPRGSR